METSEPSRWTCFEYHVLPSREDSSPPPFPKKKDFPKVWEEEEEDDAQMPIFSMLLLLGRVSFIIITATTARKHHHHFPERLKGLLYSMPTFGRSKGPRILRLLTTTNFPFKLSTNIILFKSSLVVPLEG